jgi:glycosyltransferase involved in cell wall biosynthesis
MLVLVAHFTIYSGIFIPTIYESVFLKASALLSVKFTNLTPQRAAIKSSVIVGMALYEQDRLDWLKAAIQSILGQTYGDLTFVVVIDGYIESDIEDYLTSLIETEPRLVLFKCDKNVGLSQCMNHVINYSMKYNPKFFFRMDADDISEPERIKTQLDFLECNPDISILGTGLQEIDERGQEAGERKLPLKHLDIVNFLPKRCSLNHPTVALRFTVFEEGFRYRQSLMNTQDYFLWIELANSGHKFSNLPFALLKFRRVNDFYKRRGFAKSINEFKARFYAMQTLRKYSLGNIFYAISVLTLRLMPSKVVKLAYKLDRIFLEKNVKH